MHPPRHTPYDGSSKLFEIGLKPLDLGEWIDIDAHLPEFLSEKDRLIATERDEMFAAEPGTEGAQAEVLDLLAEHLPRRFPEVYRRESGAMAVAGRRIALESSEPKLVTAARLVPEDLVLMKQGETGWRLAAAAVCFPSSWSPREKFGQTMAAVHGPVPGFGAGSRPNALINRMFDHLRPAIPVIRWNWSIYGDDRLAHRDTAAPDTRRFGAEGETAFLRAERQTLRKLPRSGDILFTVRILIDPLEALEQHSDGRRIAGVLTEQLLALDAAQLDYKGMSKERDVIVARLRRMAE